MCRIYIGLATPILCVGFTLVLPHLSYVQDLHWSCHTYLMCRIYIGLATPILYVGFTLVLPHLSYVQDLHCLPHLSYE